VQGALEEFIVGSISVAIGISHRSGQYSHAIATVKPEDDCFEQASLPEAILGPDQYHVP
jgi:hypothetical protein